MHRCNVVYRVHACDVRRMFQLLIQSKILKMNKLINRLFSLADIAGVVVEEGEDQGGVAEDDKASMPNGTWITTIV